MKKIVLKIGKFLDKHRLILIILIIFLIVSIYIGLNSLIFLNHNFKKLECTKKLDETYCYNNDFQIYINPENEKENIFKNKNKEIKALKKKYKLPEFNYYTSYFYEIAALLNFNETGENEELLIFFKNYNISYNLTNFYKKNILYYNLFYSYKINLN